MRWGEVGEVGVLTVSPVHPPASPGRPCRHVVWRFPRWWFGRLGGLAPILLTPVGQVGQIGEREG